MTSPSELRTRAARALHHVIDPELGLDIVGLGLVYGIDVDGSDVQVRLTMTTPSCPLGEHIAEEIVDRLRGTPGIESASVALVWEPPWTPELMSPSTKTQLGWTPS